MDRAAFLAAVIAELEVQNQESSTGRSARAVGSARKGYEALTYDMPTVPAVDADALVTALNTAVESIQHAMVSSSVPVNVADMLPEWFILTPKFVSNVIHCAEKAAQAAPAEFSSETSLSFPIPVYSSPPASKLAAVVCIRLVKVWLLSSAGSEVPAPHLALLCDACLSYDCISSISSDDWEALGLSSDAIGIVSFLLSKPSSLSKHWTKYLYVLRDISMFHPEYASVIVEGLFSLVKPLTGPHLASDSVIATFVNRIVLLALVDICEAPAVTGLTSVRRVTLAGIRRIAPPVSSTIERVVAMIEVLRIADGASADVSDDFSVEDISRDCCRDIDAIQRVVDVIMKWYGSEGGNALMDLGWVRASSQLAVVSITREHPLFPAKSAAIVILHSIVSQCAVACGFVFQVPGITALVSAADGSLPLPILIVWSLLCCATLPTAASSLESVGISALGTAMKAYIDAITMLRSREAPTDVAKTDVDSIASHGLRASAVLSALVDAWPVISGSKAVVATVQRCLQPLNTCVRQPFPLLVEAPVDVDRRLSVFEHSVTYSSMKENRSSDAGDAAVDSKSSAMMEKVECSVSDAAPAIDIKLSSLASQCLHTYNAIRGNLKVLLSPIGIVSKRD